MPFELLKKARKIQDEAKAALKKARDEAKAAVKKAKAALKEANDAVANAEFKADRMIANRGKRAWAWAREGQCKNEGKVDIDVCIDGKRVTLKPGESTPEGVDCDGVLHEDGSTSKHHGFTNITTHESAEWVAREWPDCAKR